ncbi:MAG: Ig-like domain-containing domain [Ramlibacter sp.]
MQTFATASDPGIRFEGASVIINPAADLLPGTNYQLVVAPGAIEDLAGNAYAGVSDYSFTTAGSAPPPGQDSTSPAAIDFFPAAGSNTLPPDWSLAITFDEAVQAGPGTITLQTAAGTVVQTFAAASDPGIRFEGSSVIIDPAADLQAGTTYKLVVSADAIEDLSGNAYAGVSEHAFTTAGTPTGSPDTTPPTVVDYSPDPDSHTLALDGNISITFDEPVKAGSAIISLAKVVGRTAVQTFVAATDPGIQFVGSTLIIDPAADLQEGTHYEVIIYRDAVEDLAGNPYGVEPGAPLAPISSRYTFFTEGPILLGRFPNNKIPVDWNMSLTFDQPVRAGSGTITLQTAAGDVVQTFVTATDPGVQFSGSHVIINPAADLQAGTAYRLVVSPDAVEDLSGIAYSGITFAQFTATASQDIVAPRAIEYVPAPGSNTLPPDSNFTITFDEPVQAGWGTITLLTAHGDWVQAFPTATDPGIHFTGSSLVIDPANNLQPGTDYKLLFGPGAVQDLAGNEAAIPDYFFTTALVGVAPA